MRTPATPNATHNLSSALTTSAAAPTPIPFIPSPSPALVKTKIYQECYLHHPSDGTLQHEVHHLWRVYLQGHASTPTPAPTPTTTYTTLVSTPDSTTSTFICRVGSSMQEKRTWKTWTIWVSGSTGK